MNSIFLISSWGLHINFPLNLHLGYLQTNQKQTISFLEPFFHRFRWRGGARSYWKMKSLCRNLSSMSGIRSINAAVYDARDHFLFKKQIFLTPVADMQTQTFTDRRKFSLFSCIWHHFFDFLLNWRPRNPKERVYLVPWIRHNFEDTKFILNAFVFV